jgi:2-oxoisovalerate dehydrogenase E1 component beta subunit
MAELTMVEALNAAISDAMSEDERVLVFGEDVARMGGVFRVTDSIADRFGPTRCFDTPLAESAIAGVSLGLAMRGYRPVAEIQFDGFLYPALDQLISHIAKFRNRTRGRVAVPLTLRIPSFGGIGSPEHHSDSPETYLVHTAGLKVVVPSTPADAYSLLRESIRSDDPVMFLEPKRRYWMKEDLELPVQTEPIGRAAVRRPGDDVTVVAYGTMVGVALEAADAAREERGVSLEVIDLRSLVPLDRETVVRSVEKTRRCVVVHEGPRTLGMGAEIAALVQEHAFLHLEAPILRATGYDTPYPPPRLEHAWLPSADRILDVVERSLAYG